MACWRGTNGRSANSVTVLDLTGSQPLMAARAMMGNVSPMAVAARIASALEPVMSRLAPLRHGATDRLLLDEEWSRIDTSRWVPFGHPRPRASAALSGFDPAGDGSYPSGVYSRDAFAIGSGLVIEAVIRVPITLPYWQHVELHLISDTFVRNIAD